MMGFLSLTLSDTFVRVSACMCAKGRDKTLLCAYTMRLSQHVEESADASGCVLGECKKRCITWTFLSPPHFLSVLFLFPSLFFCLERRLCTGDEKGTKARVASEYKRLLYGNWEDASYTHFRRPVVFSTVYVYSYISLNCYKLSFVQRSSRCLF